MARTNIGNMEQNAVTITTLDNGIGVIVPDGRLMAGDDTDVLRESANNLAARGCLRIVVDLSNVTFLDSTAIGVLVSIHTSYQRRKGRAVLCSINKGLSGIFTITNLIQIFETYPTREDALRELSMDED